MKMNRKTLSLLVGLAVFAVLAALWAAADHLSLGLGLGVIIGTLWSLAVGWEGEQRG